ncbi:MAG: hypothetical protein QM564_11225 [Bergeyella sp.]
MSSLINNTIERWETVRLNKSFYKQLNDYDIEAILKLHEKYYPYSLNLKNELKK